MLLQRLRKISRFRLDFLEQPYVLDRDHGLVGKGPQQLDVTVGEVSGQHARDANDADRRALIHQRREQHAAEAARPRDVQNGIGQCFSVGNLRDLAGLRHSKRREIGDGKREGRLQYFIRLGSGRRERLEISDAVYETEHRAGEAADQPVGVRRDRLEHRLYVRRRTGDYLQDISGRGLPLQRFSGLVEQPHILDGDHRLVGERLQQLDVMRDKGAGFGAGDADHPDRRAPIHQGGKQHTAKTAQAAQIPIRGGHVFSLGIGELHSLTIANQRKRRKFRERSRKRFL